VAPHGLQCLTENRRTTQPRWSRDISGAASYCRLTNRVLSAVLMTSENYRIRRKRFRQWLTFVCHGHGARPRHSLHPGTGTEVSPTRWWKLVRISACRVNLAYSHRHTHSILPIVTVTHPVHIACSRTQLPATPGGCIHWISTRLLHLTNPTAARQCLVEWSPRTAATTSGSRTDSHHSVYTTPGQQDRSVDRSTILA